MKLNKILFYGQLLLYIIVIGNILYSTKSTNILFARVGDQFSAHSANWLFIVIAAIIIRIKTPIERGISGVIDSILAVAFIGAITEGMFHLFYAIYNPEYITLAYYNLVFWEIVSGIGVGIYYKIYKLFNKRNFLTVFLALFVFFIAWLITGYHVTYSFSHTYPWPYVASSAYYYDIPANEMDFVQWILGCIGLSLTYLPKKEYRDQSDFSH